MAGAARVMLRLYVRACARAWCRRSIKAAWSRAGPVTGWIAAPAAGAQQADLRYKLEDGFLADLVNVKESTYFFCIIFPSYTFFLQATSTRQQCSPTLVEKCCLVHDGAVPLDAKCRTLWNTYFHVDRGCGYH